jgi:hypothetical protein
MFKIFPVFIVKCMGHLQSLFPRSIQWNCVSLFPLSNPWNCNVTKSPCNNTIVTLSRQCCIGNYYTRILVELIFLLHRSVSPGVRLAARVRISRQDEDCSNRNDKTRIRKSVFNVHHHVHHMFITMFITSSQKIASSHKLALYRYAYRGH